MADNMTTSDILNEIRQHYGEEGLLEELSDNMDKASAKISSFYRNVRDGSDIVDETTGIETAFARVLFVGDLLSIQPSPRTMNAVMNEYARKIHNQERELEPEKESEE